MLLVLSLNYLFNLIGKEKDCVCKLVSKKFSAISQLESFSGTKTIW